ncbi:MAG: DUF1294 domain-containing protein [Christensenellales bacterium]|jgi:uncharacterized membrane protein YsdA (DUF1294 family)
MPEFVWWVLAAWNVLCCVMMAADKRAARKGRRRIPKARLLGCGALFGAGGIVGGMLLFRHKTRQGAFAVGMPVALVVQCAVLVYKVAEWAG